MIFRLIILFGALLFTAIRANTEKEVKAIERAHAATKEIKANFRKTLAQALASEKASKALSECKVKAPRITEGKKTNTFIGIGRTSHRLRNDRNAPPEWIKTYLKEFSSAKKENIPPHKLVVIGENHYGYMEPIFVEPICLNCHGKNVGKEVQEAIKKEYPKDEAVGFEVGDFRGLLWLEMKDPK